MVAIKVPLIPIIGVKMIFRSKPNITATNNFFNVKNNNGGVFRIDDKTVHKLEYKT